MKKLFIAAFMTVAALSAQAVAPSTTSGTFDVKARENSSSGGSGLDTIFVTAGQTFSVIAGTTDLWSAGALPRWSNANGLTGNLFATGSDESGATAGTQIGQIFQSLHPGRLHCSVWPAGWEN